MKRFKINKYLKYSLLLFTGVLLGWLFFHSSDKKTTAEAQHTESEETIWTCSMHPQIRMHAPGDCPICGMDLIPLEQGKGISGLDSFAVHLTPEAVQLANVMTTLAERKKPVKVIRLYGKIEADERLLQSQTSHIPGRIEDLKVNFTGETIRTGQVLATIYSPELITAQQELIEAAKFRDIQPEIYMAARERLLHWKLTEDQINSIEHGHSSHEFDVVSNTSGVVIQRLVNSGDHVSEGSILFQVADLSKVWALFDAYESDLPFINKGANITFTVQALPGNSFSGLISFIDPVIDPVTRVAKVRVEVNNKSGRLKPQMFVTGTVQSRLNQFNNDIVIPKSAVLWTGERSIVYVKDADSEDPLFRMREVTLGPSLGESYVVTGGLNEGEAVVTQGAFSVDAASQLEGKPSMMNPDGGKTSTAHNHDEQTPSGQKESIDHSKHQTNINNEKINVSIDFTMQLNDAFDQYITLKNAFVQSDNKKVKQAAVKVQQSLSKVNVKLLTGDAHRQWMDILNGLNKGLGIITSATKIEEQRTAFAETSEQIHKAIKIFGLMGKTVYYQFCPMAGNGSGAYWLSEKEDIENPYYGESMLTCGENKEKLIY